MSARSYLSIGDVLTLLRQEFPDVTISKIRFLESQGLVNPERTPSGYRKFYEHDVERLRWVLRQQREHFLPLKVIKGRLDGDAGVPADPSADVAATDAGSDQAAGHAGQQADRELRVLVGQHAGAAGAGAPPPASAPAASRPATTPPPAAPAAPAAAPTSAASGTPSSGGAAPTPAPASAPVASPSSGPAPSAPTDRGRPPTASSNGPTPPDVPAGPGAAAAAQSTSTGPTAGAPDGRPPSAPASAADRAPSTSTGPAAPSTPPAPAPAAAPAARPAVPAEPPATDPPAADPAALLAGQTGASLTLGELEAASGLDAAAVAELREYGLLRATTTAGTEYFDEEALAVALAAARFASFGVEARHLRLYKNSAEREAGFIEQVVTPLVRQRHPEARARASQTSDELTRIGNQLRASLLRQALRDLLDG